MTNIRDFVESFSCIDPKMSELFCIAIWRRNSVFDSRYFGYISFHITDGSLQWFTIDQ